MRGRKPKPTVLKELHGNPGRRPLPKGEPIAQGALMEPPAWLSEDAKEGWRYALKHAPAGLLRKIDAGVLAVWVVAESLHRQATQKQDAIGGLVYKPKGSEVHLQSPYLAIINKQAMILLKAASELGFSPVARPRITGEEAGLPATPATMNQKHAGPPPLAQFLASNPDRQVH